MSKISDSQKLHNHQEDPKNTEVFKKAAISIDFILYIIKKVGKYIEKIAENLSNLPEPSTTYDAVEALSTAQNAFIVSRNIVINLLPSKSLCDESLHTQFWNLHSAYMVHHYDALILLEHSLISALMGYYTVAYVELRSVLEDIVRGIIFDLITIPKYRNNAKEIEKIKGFGDSKGFNDLVKVLSELADKRLDTSIQVFDIIDNELKDFNPESKFTKLLVQLKEWNIIDGDILGKINNLYVELSRYVHRIHPMFSEVGKRIITDRDWLELEPVPEELFRYLKYFTEICGWMAYLTIRDYITDMQDVIFNKCIDRQALYKIIKDVEGLGNSCSWEKTYKILKQIIEMKNTSN